MTSLSAAILGAAMCVTVAASTAAADVVVDWNLIADTTPIVGGPPIRNRMIAMVQVAVHDALNAIDPRYASYAGGIGAAPGASADAAVAAAAYHVLIGAVPAQAGPLATIYNNYVAGLPACPAEFPSCVDDGEAVGYAAAQTILALRANDGSTTPHLTYSAAAAPGVHQPTPPAFAPPQFAGWALVTPFVLNSGSQFRAEPGEIFALTGEAYTRDFNEVKGVGRIDAETLGLRTPDQSEVARYWPGGGSNFNAVTRTLLATRNLDTWEQARLFALVTMASHDGTVAVFDTKYAYNFWRPVTAIRAADTDGNPDTAPDTAWLSYQVTPPYPDYVCGLTTNVGASTEVLRRYFGTDVLPYTLTAGGATRSFSTLSDAEAEAVDARVFGGMHFRSGCVGGIRLGNHVGRFVIQHALKPVKESGAK